MAIGVQANYQDNFAKHDNFLIDDSGEMVDYLGFFRQGGNLAGQR